MAQKNEISIQKPVLIWVQTKEGPMQKGVFLDGDTHTLFIYPGSMKDYLKQKKPDTLSIGYENIRLIKMKKKGGLLTGMLIGAGIGLSPIVFGQGGAFVAIISLPVGIIAGSIVGATAKKKYRINGDLNHFQKFTEKYIK